MSEKSLLYGICGATFSEPLKGRCSLLSFAFLCRDVLLPRGPHGQRPGGPLVRHLAAGDRHVRREDPRVRRLRQFRLRHGHGAQGGAARNIRGRTTSDGARLEMPF